ncbi:MAG: crossover junction endodeoxyribonuclease RuvC [bacterium]|nr:crossover junction endodeoxyribonuclease RuvC [bacterium]
MTEKTYPISLRILGIDPGFGRTGLGVVDLIGNDAIHVWHEVIETSPDMSFVERIQIVRNDLVEVIRRFSPHVASVEDLFFQSNAKTAMKVGMARGVLLLGCADAGLPIVEVKPNELKLGITGYGKADKKQVEEMVVRLLKMDHAPDLDDASDALALAIVGGFMYRTMGKVDSGGV